MANPFDAIPAALGSAAASVATRKANPFDAIDPPPVTADSVVRSLAHGASFGLADEISAGGDALVGPALDWTLGKLGLGSTNTSTAPTYGERYDQNLAKERGQDKAFADAHPYVNAAGNIAGSIGGAIATLPLLPAKLVGVSPSVAGNVARSVGGGAAAGAAQGFGEGEGLEDRLGRAGIGGAFGAAGGAIARPVAAIGRSIGESALGRGIGDYVVNPIAQLPAKLGSALIGREAPIAAESVAQSGALERLATALQRGKTTPEAIGARADYLGPQTVLADTNDQLMSAARGAKVMQGETRSLAPEVLLAREKGAPERMKGAFTEGYPVASTHDLMSEGGLYAQNVKGVGRGAYQGEMAGAGLQMSPELDKLMAENPTAKGALKSVMDSIVEASKGRPDFVPPPPVEIMHMVKQQLQGLGYDSMSGRPLPTQQVWRDFASNFVTKLKASNQELAKADVAYAQAKSLPEHFQQGYNFLTPTSTTEKGLNASSPALAEALARANPQQKTATQAGNINQIVDLLSGRGAVPKTQALARDVQTGTELQARLGQIHGPQKAAEILRQAEAEQAYKATTDQLVRGSQTAEKASDALDQAGNIGFRATPSGGIVPKVSETLGAFTRWVRSPNEAIRDEIGRLTLNPNAKNNAETLALLAQLLKARAGGTATSSGISGALGGQAGGL